MLDIVYVVKDGDDNEELRYSLRSLANYPHRYVFMVGYKPDWVSNQVLHIPDHNDHGSKYQNSTHHMRMACESKRVSEDFVYMNDDFFIMEPITEIPTMHRGNVQFQIQSHSTKGVGAYVRGMKTTRNALNKAGIDRVLSYELHIPYVVNKKNMIKLLNSYKDIPFFHKRTAYGNIFKIGGQFMSDVKVYNKNPKFDFKDTTFLSTLDSCFRDDEVGRYIRERFPNKCDYEI